MTQHIDYWADPLAARFTKHLNSAGKIIDETTLPRAVRDLVKIRASQINGCSTCTEMHTKDAAASGETTTRLTLVAAWRDATVFSPAERAALEFTEEGTRLADAHTSVADATWEEAKEHFDTEQLCALVSLVALINAYNRVNAITRTPAGGYAPGQWS